MRFELAPMEGITGHVFRRNYHKHFEGMDRYYTPFLASKKMNHKEKNEILPENNKGMLLVPQILTNQADTFLAIAGKLAEYGYKEVNLNLGCPSATVVSRRRGAGFLGELQDLSDFLDEIFYKCPLKISIKTRLGIEFIEEWEDILEIYQKYPIERLIIHTRLQKEFYKGKTHPESFVLAQESLHVPLCYNGDIFTKEDLTHLMTQIRDLSTVMLGRGIIANPFLLEECKGVQKNEDKKERLLAFLDDLGSDYRTLMSGDTNALYKMKEVWNFLGNSFVDCAGELKKIKKAKRWAEYEAAAKRLVMEHDQIPKV